MSARLRGVSIVPGRIALTVMPRSFSFLAQALGEPLHAGLRGGVGAHAGPGARGGGARADVDDAALARARAAPATRPCSTRPPCAGSSRRAGPRSRLAVLERLPAESAGDVHQHVDAAEAHRRRRASPCASIPCRSGPRRRAAGVRTRTPTAAQCGGDTARSSSATLSAAPREGPGHGRAQRAERTGDHHRPVARHFHVQHSGTLTASPPWLVSL